MVAETAGERIADRYRELGLLCALLGEGLLCNPAGGVADRVRSAEGVQLVQGLLEPAEAERVAALLERSRQRESERDLGIDYTRLFVGTPHPAASPWESVWRGDEGGVLFQKETLQARQAYGKYGLQLRNLHREPDDSAACEFEFLGILGRRIAETCGTDELAGALMRNDFDWFARTHVVSWVPRFAELVAEQARTDYFRAAAAVTAYTVGELGRQCAAADE